MPGFNLQETKNDLNRIGLFSELGYISIGDPFKTQKNGKYIFDMSSVVRRFCADSVRRIPSRFIV